MCIELTNICFKNECVQIDVKMTATINDVQRRKLAEALLQKYPFIKEHACKNSHGPTFGDCIQTTSVPHILEHVILEECKKSKVSDIDYDVKNKVSDFSGKNKLFVGKTTNLSEDLAKIELKYYDDIFMLNAINRATTELNNMLNNCRKTAS